MILPSFMWTNSHQGTWSKYLLTHTLGRLDSSMTIDRVKLTITTNYLKIPSTF